MAEYSEYLHSGAWRYRRDRAIWAAQRRCQNPDCKHGYVRALYDSEIVELEIPYRLDVHHLTYERLGHENPDDLIVLCSDCHCRVHGIEEQPNPEFRRRGPVADWPSVVALAVSRIIGPHLPPANDA
jgi:hypothetical protein